MTLPAKTVHAERSSESEVEAYRGRCATPFDFTLFHLGGAGSKKSRAGGLARPNEGRCCPASRNNSQSAVSALTNAWLVGSMNSFPCFCKGEGKRQRPGEEMIKFLDCRNIIRRSWAVFIRESSLPYCTFSCCQASTTGRFSHRVSAGMDTSIQIKCQIILSVVWQRAEGLVVRSLQYTPFFAIHKVILSHEACGCGEI